MVPLRQMKRKSRSRSSTLAVIEDPRLAVGGKRGRRRELHGGACDVTVCFARYAWAPIAAAGCDASSRSANRGITLLANRSIERISLSCGISPL